MIIESISLVRDYLHALFELKTIYVHRLTRIQSVPGMGVFFKGFSFFFLGAAWGSV